MSRLIFIVALAVTLLILAPQAYAQPPSHPDGTIKAEFENRFNSRISGSSTKVSSQKYNIQARYSYFNLTYNYKNYSWDSADDSGLAEQGKDPWSGLHSISLGARKNFFLSPEWLLNIGGGVGSSFEKEISGSFWGRADFSFVRLFENNWSTNIGLAGFYHPVRSIVLPVVMIGYSNPDPQGFSGRLGFPETSLTYAFNESLAAKAHVGYSANIYRLKNNSPVHKKGYFSDQAFKIGLDMEIRPARNLTLNFGPYYLMERKLKTYDRHEKRQNKEKIKNTPGIKLGASWIF